MISVVILLLFYLTEITSFKVDKNTEFEVGSQPSGLTVYDNTLYVALRGEGAIALFDVNQITPVNVSRWDAPGGPFDVVVDSKGERLAFSQSSSSSISFYTIQNGRFGGSTSVPSGPTYITLDSDNDIGYLTSLDADILISFSLTTQDIIRSYRTGVDPFYITLSRFGRLAYVSNKGESSISIINLINGLSSKITLPAGSSPSGSSLTRRDEFLLVTNSVLGSLLFINTTDYSITRSLAVGYNPTFVDVSDDGLYAFVANTGSSSVSVVDINLQTVIETIPVGISPTVVRSFENKIYVSNSGSGTVTVVQFS